MVIDSKKEVLAKKEFIDNLSKQAFIWATRIAILKTDSGRNLIHVLRKIKNGQTSKSKKS